MNPVLIAGLAMQGAGYLNGAFNKAKMRPTMKYGDAAQRAGVLLNPQYNTQMQQALTSVNNDLINRGFFGQAEGASLASQTAGQVEGAKQSAITQYAQGLMDADYQKALDQYNMEQAGKDRITNGLMGVGGLLSGIGGTLDERQYAKEQAQAQQAFETQAADTAWQRKLQELGIQNDYSMGQLSAENNFALGRQNSQNDYETNKMYTQAELDRATNAAQELLKQQTYKANAQTDISLLPKQEAIKADQAIRQSNAEFGLRSKENTQQFNNTRTLNRENNQADYAITAMNNKAAADRATSSAATSLRNDMIIDDYRTGNDLKVAQTKAKAQNKAAIEKAQLQILRDAAKGKADGFDYSKAGLSPNAIKQGYSSIAQSVLASLRNTKPDATWNDAYMYVRDNAKTFAQDPGNPFYGQPKLAAQFAQEYLRPMLAPKKKSTSKKKTTKR